MKSKFLLLLLSVAVVLSSCITTKDTELLQDIPKNYPIETPPDYKIIPGDRLILTIYTLNEDMKSLFSVYIKQGSTVQLNTGGMSSRASGSLSGGGGSNNLLVSMDGNIRIPYVGKIQVEGLTLLEARELVAERFRGFSDQVTIDLTLQNTYFYVLGEAGCKSINMDKQRYTILQALSVSGSITRVGNRKEVKIIRQTAEGTQIKVFDLRSKDVLDSEFYYIQPNDIIYIPKLGRTFWGEIGSVSSILNMISTVIGTATLAIFVADQF
ncbi:polysaccharide export outer membrane protein [Dysgonomonas sp. PH5-45]|uniref:polysaccharide biosynthesis/export family protein n=1 Tax=unclassified Dysgonomonas TaxID=2630389 RepID=UPI002473EFA8|nr:MULTISPECIES: polysaccharide biosynthesis/export family protein [unclassified Dysgonomonas]MDH6353830.1 polysaccharide export outer membrane protein [Dysgonomonas sp. PH5-45]MDH6386732.1 polysaccharide export outer membrane protein [Dysgonomonas sp. PH5-37]